jgi:hypothetical protein
MLRSRVQSSAGALLINYLLIIKNKDKYYIGFLNYFHMAESLISRLRMSNSPEDRRSIAIELAQTGSDMAVLELIRMAECKVRKRSHVSCWFHSYYGGRDQLNAIQALGESGNEHALEYLERIYSAEKGEESTFERATDSWFGDHAIYENVTEIPYKFPNSPINFRNLLDYMETKTECFGYNDETHTKNAQVHDTFINAINKLKSTLQK